jgi:hypothetical protein
VFIGLGCGKGGSLPDGSDGDGLDNLPGNPSENQTDAAKSLWPLSTGSRWTYRITDDVRGVFEKQVEVLGPQAVPGASQAAIAVRSIQPHLEELSWQIDNSGLVVRLREEDRKSGALARVTTWNPSTIKSLSLAKPFDWSHSAMVHEITRGPDGVIIDEDDKEYIWRVLAVDVDVTTAAGSFKAMKVQRDRPDKTGKERIYWLVPGVGKVREEGERTEELLNFEIK